MYFRAFNFRTNQAVRNNKIFAIYGMRYSMWWIESFCKDKLEAAKTIPLIYLAKKMQLGGGHLSRALHYYIVCMQLMCNQ